MISRKQVEEILDEQTLQKYNEEMEKYREGCFDRNYKKDWDDYISLPILEKLDIQPIKINTNALLLVHPGWGIYSDAANEITNNMKEEFGDYQKEYLEPMLERVKKAKKAKETIIVFTEESTLKETSDLIGDGVIFVPTYNPPNICDNILGVKEKEFINYLEKNGVKDIEIGGEWTGICLDKVEKRLSNYNNLYGKPFKIKKGNRFPVRGEYHDDFLFQMTKEEEKKYEETTNEIYKWIDEKFKEYTSKFDLEANSCSSKILDIILFSFHDDYIWPGNIYATCKEDGVEEILNSLDFFEEKGLIKIEKASDVLEQGLNERLEFGRLDYLRKLNEIAKKELKFKPGEIIIPMIRRNV